MKEKIVVVGAPIIVRSDTCCGAEMQLDFNKAMQCEGVKVLTNILPTVSGACLLCPMQRYCPKLYELKKEMREWTTDDKKLEICFHRCYCSKNILEPIIAEGHGAIKISIRPEQTIE